MNKANITILTMLLFSLACNSQNNGLNVINSTTIENDPSLGFYFQLKVENETYNFKEALRMPSEDITDEISEGDEIRFEYKIPTNIKYVNLELKKGIVPENSKLMAWITETIESGSSNKIKTKTIEVSLLNKKGDILLSWNFYNAWPVAWNGASLNTINNEVLIESLSMSYSIFKTID